MDNSWNEYQKLVLHELERLSEAVESLIRVQGEQTTSIESLKIKSGFIATISGFITAIGFDLTKYFYNK